MNTTSHPMHICLDCGSMVSSTRDARTAHAHWHEDVNGMRATWHALEQAADAAETEEL